MEDAVGEGEVLVKGYTVFKLNTYLVIYLYAAGLSPPFSKMMVRSAMSI